MQQQPTGRPTTAAGAGAGAGADTTKDNSSIDSISKACAYGDFDRLKAFVEAGGSVNVPDEQGYYPLQVVYCVHVCVLGAFARCNAVLEHTRAPTTTHLNSTSTTKKTVGRAQQPRG